MNYNNIFNNSISQLGMGFTAHKNNTQEMVDKAISCGMNYFEVATFYLNGKCEEIAGQALSKYNRNQFFLCDKLPVRLLYHQCRTGTMKRPVPFCWG